MVERYNVKCIYLNPDNILSLSYVSALDRMDDVELAGGWIVLWLFFGPV